MQIVFTFTVNPETQEATFVGNIDMQTALQILQQLAIADAVKQAQEKGDETPKTQAG